MEIRTKAVVFYEEGIRSAKEIGELYSPLSADLTHIPQVEIQK